MHFYSLTNGENNYQQWLIEEHHTGLHGEQKEEAKETVKKIFGHEPVKGMIIKTCWNFQRLWRRQW